MNAYIDEHRPATQTESDLVQEIAVSKWLQRHCWALQTALLDVTMDRMEDEIDEEFTELPNATRTALAFVQQASANGAFAACSTATPAATRASGTKPWTNSAPSKKKNCKTNPSGSGPARPDDPTQNDRSRSFAKRTRHSPSDLAVAVPQNEPERALNLLKSIAPAEPPGARV